MICAERSELDRGRVELQFAREFLNKRPGSFNVALRGVKITDRQPERIAPVELGVG